MIDAFERILCAAMKSSGGWTIAFAALTVGSAVAQTTPVYPGCDVPKPSERGRTFYIDPVHGSSANDGSKERPWRTLAEVVDPANHLIATRAYATGRSDGPRAIQPVNPDGAIRPDDTLTLMSGDHGAVSLRQAVNDDFIFVVAGAGQTPIVRSMAFAGSSHWIFRDIKFQSERPEGNFEKKPYDSLIEFFADGFYGPSDNVVFENDSISSVDDTSIWSPEDWVHKPYATGLKTFARCVAIVGNHFFNLRDALSVAGNESLVQDNVIDNMGNDGMDIMASDLTIRANRISDSRHSSAEPLHADGIQGWTLNGATNRNVVIESNRIVNYNTSDDNYLQGISIFDGHWDGLTVANNVVITNIWHGIALYGVENVKVINNTVVAARPDKFPTWITIHEGEGKTPSRHVLVRNNIAAQFIIDGEDITFDHNVAQRSMRVRVRGGANANENIVVETARGSFGGHNFVNVGAFAHFVDYDPRGGRFDLRPDAFSPAREAGADDQTPSLDIDGRPRVSPVDIGASAR